eukprot:m.118464 g.118464  ORF g.118464 m.118464 type:complete len:198 (+) comp9342_c0_seq1:502-1095(+)
MKFLLLAFAVVAVATTSVFAQEDEVESNARLLVAKSVVNDIAVVGRDLTIRYSFHNAGNTAATDIEVNDEGFVSEKSGLELVSGLTSFSIDEIAAGESVVHNVVVRPQQAGFYNMTAARVEYKSDDVEIAAISSFPTNIRVIPADDYARVYDSHFLDWAVFIVVAFLVVYLPFSKMQKTYQRAGQSQNNSSSKKKKN